MQVPNLPAELAMVVMPNTYTPCPKGAGPNALHRHFHAAPPSLPTPTHLSVVGDAHSGHLSLHACAQAEGHAVALKRMCGNA